MTTGSARMVYDVCPQWEQLPDGWTFVEVAGVATDSEDRVYVFNRGEHPVIVLDRAGRFLRAWGEGQFKRPHGISITAADEIYCTDDLGHHVLKFTPDGRLLAKLGTGVPSDTGVVGFDYRTIRKAAGPFNLPTNVAFSQAGEIYVTDGYGNARVHKFSPEGELLASWGEPGAGPGQFHLPHGIAVDGHGIVYVADRENSRIQRFTPLGEYVNEWHVARPCQVFVDAGQKVFVAELGYRAGMYSGNSPPEAASTGGRVSVFTRQGELLARWGGGQQPCAPGDFFAPHGIAVDSRGDVYVGEVVMSAGGKAGLVPESCHSLQKFTRRA